MPGAILVGMAGTALAGWASSGVLGLEPALVSAGGIAARPPAPSAAFQLDLAGLLARPAGDWLTIVAVFLFLDLFDTVGSLLGLGRQAGLLDERGRLPRAREALASDAAGTVAGALLGTSTVTSYVESAAGIASGGRTGLVAVVVGLCFLAALPLPPLVAAVGAGVEVAPGVMRYPVIAPALLLVGALMLRALGDVRWDDPLEAFPAFLTAVVIPLGFSIADGIGWGLVATAWIALVQRRRVPRLVHVLALLYLGRHLLAV